MIQCVSYRWAMGAPEVNLNKRAIGFGRNVLEGKQFGLLYIFDHVRNPAFIVLDAPRAKVVKLLVAICPIVTSIRLFFKVNENRVVDNVNARAGVASSADLDVA